MFAERRGRKESREPQGRPGLMVRLVRKEKRAPLALKVRLGNRASRAPRVQSDRRVLLEFRVQLDRKASKDKLGR